MQSFKYTITDPVGIHARPAGNLVKVIKEFASAVTISGNGKTVDAKKLMSVMTLGIRQGQEVELTFEGPDEETACAEVERYMKENI
ncbi:MAG: HPr family phosphocarrier protein [Lachnospiraceae bacterium]|nr:HPr family phosphocarrier protein [Lachnospiraceae bacterium]